MPIASTWATKPNVREINGTSVLITGGGSAIGAGAAKHFVHQGARVTISGRREESLQAVASRLGDNCHVVVGEVASAADRERMVDGAVDHGSKLDALISNAGNMHRNDVVDFYEQQLLDVFNTNVVAGMMLCKQAHDHLVVTHGCIVFVGSVHTQRAFPNVSPYAAIKGALEALTGVLAAELGKDNFRVSCVRPGAVLTEINVRAGVTTADEQRERRDGMGSMHALGRINTVQEIAEAFEYLVRAGWSTGNVLTVDGGLGLGVTKD